MFNFVITFLCALYFIAIYMKWLPIHLDKTRREELYKRSKWFLLSGSVIFTLLTISYIPDVIP